MDAFLPHIPGKKQNIGQLVKKFTIGEEENPFKERESIPYEFEFKQSYDEPKENRESKDLKESKEGMENKEIPDNKPEEDHKARNESEGNMYQYTGKFAEQANLNVVDNRNFKINNDLFAKVQGK